MSEPDDTKKAKMGIHSYDAAAAAVAQSIANAAQDQVDLIRNQNFIKTIAMGNAYAKWLENPVMKDEFRAVIETSNVDEPKFALAKEIFRAFESQNFKSKSGAEQAASTE